MYELTKKERLSSKKLIDELFQRTPLKEGESRQANPSFTVYPLRLVWMQLDRTEGEPPVSILISVPKKRFHHAVDRNRLKRQVREAYRLQKHILWNALQPQKRILIAFISLADSPVASEKVSRCVRKSLQRIADQVISGGFH